MAQHGSPGIHAGRPTTQNLRSASRRAGRSKTSAKTRSTARRGGLQADLFSEAHFSKQAGWQQSIYRLRQSCQALRSGVVQRSDKITPPRVSAPPIRW
ncbi:hypothetical protein F7Q95_15825 [Pseudomonas psychrophila]|nr:hypothetical protein F7Q95_15825 [Pseudomonas psychrophila]